MAHHRSGSTSNSPPPASSKSAAARLPTVSSTSSAGGGNNTELRAQIRKEREASKTNVLGVTGGGAGHSVKRELSSSSSTASLAGTKQQFSSSQHVDAAQPAQLDRRSSSSHLDGYMMAPPVVQQAAPMSTASKRLSTGSAVAAAVRKLEEDAKARDAHHAVFSITRSGSTGSAKAPSARERRSTDEVILEGGVPESYDHSFGIETLSAAFSAKYYELANKCKSWERYAAQLRARAEALDIDNRILRETSDRQERHVVALEAENAVLRSQNEQREARAREVEDRLTHLEAHVAETAHRRQDNTSGTGSSQCASSPSPREHNSAYHSSNLATSSGERNRRGPTPLSSSEREQDHDQISQTSIPQQQQQRAKRPLSMGPANDHYSHLQHSQTNTTIQPQYPAAQQQQQHAYAPQAYPHLYQHPHAHAHALPHAALPKRRSVNSMDPDVVKTSASLPVLYLGSGGVARSRGMSVSSSLSEATMVAPPPGQPVRGMMPHVRSETVGPDCTAPAQGGGRRRLRRTSLNQQQQLAALQAQRDTSASSSSASVSSLNAARPPSRTASRMSVRTTRSRAGSATVHDSIPAVKDDMFSTSSASLSSGRDAITHSQSQPLLSGNRNASNGSLGPPAATVGPHAHTIHLAAAAGQRGHAPLMPLPQWTNVEGRAQYPASTSDGVLYGGHAQQHHPHHLATTTSHPLFARTASSTSLGGSSILTRTSSSGEIALPKIEDGDEGSESAAAVVHDVVDKATLRRRDASEDDAAALTASATSSPTASASASTSATEEDKRGAHRRLYIALRSELDSTDLAKFERYVHRYDAMEIPIDGPRGLVNRVKKLLLLADPTLRGRPEDLRRRKGLAREFERIVRVDLGGTPKAGGEELAAREATA